MLIAKEILDMNTIANDKSPPIKDFICIIFIMGISFCNIILLVLLSKAQNRVALRISMFPIKLLFKKKSILFIFKLRIINAVNINMIPIYAILLGLSFNKIIASKIENRNSALINSDELEALVNFKP